MGVQGYGAYDIKAEAAKPYILLFRAAEEAHFPDPQFPEDLGSDPEIPVLEGSGRA